MAWQSRAETLLRKKLIARLRARLPERMSEREEKPSGVMRCDFLENYVSFTKQMVKNKRHPGAGARALFIIVNRMQNRFQVPPTSGGRVMNSCFDFRRRNTWPFTAAV